MPSVSTPNEPITDLSRVDDDTFTHVVHEAFRRAVREAIDDAHHKGLDTIIGREDKVYRVKPDGTRVLVTRNG